MRWGSPREGLSPSQWRAWPQPLRLKLRLHLRLQWQAWPRPLRMGLRLQLRLKLRLQLLLKLRSQWQA